MILVRLFKFIAYLTAAVIMAALALLAGAIILVMAVPIGLFCAILFAWYILSQGKDETKRAA